MSESLTTLYRSILDSLNATTDSTGLVSIRNDDETMPCMVEQKRLALPTRELLSRGNWEANGLQPFHPLSEHLHRGESSVLKKLRMLVQVRLAISYQELLQTLVRLCADKKQHAKVSPKGAAVLQILPSATEKTVADFERILEAASMKGVGNIVKVYLRRGGTFQGQRVPRMCVVRFPLLEEFDTDTSVVHGVKLSKKDFNGLRALLEYVTPDHEKVETYGAGSVSDYAPYFDALMRGYIKTAERLNSLIHLYRKHMDNEDQLKIDLSWAEDFDDLGQYRNDIPPLSGNEGEVMDDSVAGVQKAIVSETAGSDSRRRLREAAASETPASYGTSTSTNVSSPTSTGGFNADAAANAVRAPSIAAAITPQPTANRSSGGPKTFAELEAERNKSLYGQAAMPAAMPMMHPMAAPPGSYPGFAYGQPQAYPPQMGYPAPMMPMGGGYPPQMMPMQYPQQPMYPQQGVAVYPQQYSI